MENHGRAQSAESTKILHQVICLTGASPLGTAHSIQARQLEQRVKLSVRHAA